MAPIGESRIANPGTTVPFGKLTATRQPSKKSGDTVVYKQKGTNAGRVAYDNFDWSNLGQNGYVLS